MLPAIYNKSSVAREFNFQNIAAVIIILAFHLQDYIDKMLIRTAVFLIRGIEDSFFFSFLHKVIMWSSLKWVLFSQWIFRLMRWWDFGFVYFSLFCLHSLFLEWICRFFLFAFVLSFLYFVNKRNTILLFGMMLSLSSYVVFYGLGRRH